MKKQDNKVDTDNKNADPQLSLNFNGAKAESEKNRVDAKVISIQVNTERQRQSLLSDIIKNTKSF
jgi:hypothetical protein